MNNQKNAEKIEKNSQILNKFLRDFFFQDFEGKIYEKTTLHIYFINFPSQTMKRGWYNGVNSLYGMTITSCDLYTIEEGAFDSIALRDMAFLKFDDVYGIQIAYQPGCLKGLRSLHKFAAKSVVFTSTDGDFLAPIKWNIRYIQLINATDEHFIANAFGELSFPRLEKIIIKATSNLVVVSRRTFGLDIPVLSTLVLESCGIEVIEEGAFEIIQAKMTTLSLWGNRLKTLPPELFRHFRPDAELHLGKNPWKCQCLVLELDVRFPFLSYQFRKMCNKDNCRVEEEALALDLRRERSCMFHDGVDTLFTSHYRFTAKVWSNDPASETIHVRSHQFGPPKVYVLILFLKSFVFENEFDAKCFFANGSLQQPINITVAGLKQRSLPHVLHIFDTSKKVWPLNIWSIRPTCDGNDSGWILEDERTCVMFVFGGIMAIAMCLGALTTSLVIIRYPVFIRDLNRVVVINSKSIGGVKRSTIIFVMPPSWQDTRNREGIHTHVTRQ